VTILRDDRGSIGIGAMIVFIALILVAAVASTVIIKTIEDLQQSGENTASNSKNLISNRVLVEGAYLTFNGAADCEATLYQHSAFGGWSATYPVGDYEGNDFLDPDNDGNAEATSNDASSIKVDDGCEIIMYDNPDFSGWSARLGGGDHSLADIRANSRPINCGGSGCNDEISSIKVLGFEVEFILKLASGSGDVSAGDISWSISCDVGGSASTDSENIVFGGASFLDNTNTEGVEINFISTEMLEVGPRFKVEATFKTCSPQIGDNIPLMIHVEDGATSYYTLPIRDLSLGTDIFFNS